MSSSPPSSSLTVALEAALGPVDVRRTVNGCSDRAEAEFETLETTDRRFATQGAQRNQNQMPKTESLGVPVWTVENFGSDLSGYGGCGTTLALSYGCRTLLPSLSIPRGKYRRFL